MNLSKRLSAFIAMTIAAFRIVLGSSALHGGGHTTQAGKSPIARSKGYAAPVP